MNNMVKKTKRRLMWFFAFLTMLFLILFVVMTYVTVSHSIMSDQKEQVVKMISDESLSRLIHEAGEAHEKAFDRNLFALVRKSGEVLEKEGDGIQEMIADWKPTSLETKEIDWNNREYLLAGKAISDVGYVYSGVDVTEQKNVLKRLSTVLLMLTVLFTFAAMLLSFFMAGKAIRPIIQSIESQREFVNDASHELRTPLSILTSGFEIIEAEEGDQLSDFSKQTVEDMAGEVRRMSSLVNDLLVLARSDSGKLVLEKEQFNLSELIASSVRSFSRIGEAKGVSFTSKLKNEVYVVGDKERLQQLLYLLLDNALKYNVEGGSIHVQLSECDAEILMSVEDTGIGIAPEHQQKVFDRFYRVDQSRSRNQGSNGIGLSIARLIVEAHEGRIVLNSTIDKGTSFTIILSR